MSIEPITFPTINAPELGHVADLGTTVPTIDAATPLTSGFSDALAIQADRLNAMHTKTDDLAVRAATGDLQDVHDYTIAANESQLATETVVALRNKAVEAFSEIMRTSV